MAGLGEAIPVADRSGFALLLRCGMLSWIRGISGTDLSVMGSTSGSRSKKIVTKKQNDKAVKIFAAMTLYDERKRGTYERFPQSPDASFEA
jgi:hypothetical protein